jgi:hypothetical protein
MRNTLSAGKGDLWVLFIRFSLSNSAASVSRRGSRLAYVLGNGALADAGEIRNLFSAAVAVVDKIPIVIVVFVDLTKQSECSDALQGTFFQHLPDPLDRLVIRQGSFL